MNKRNLMILGGALILAVAIYTIIAFVRPSGERSNGDRQSRTVQVTIYYPNPEYVRTGKEEMPRVLPVEREIELKQGESLAQSVMDLLANPPLDSETTLGKINVLGVEVDEETAYVNFSSQELYGGSLEETLLIEQVVRTLTGLPDINQVQFLVDGEPSETLMGHYGVESPLTVDDL